MNLKDMKLGQTILAEPEDKDIKRLIDMSRKASGNLEKLEALARQMAKAITGRDKATRRAEAAEQVLKGKEKDLVSQIFYERAEQL
jgi:hypothetical protein